MPAYLRQREREHRDGDPDRESREQYQEHHAPAVLPLVRELERLLRGKPVQGEEKREYGRRYERGQKHLRGGEFRPLSVLRGTAGGTAEHVGNVLVLRGLDPYVVEPSPAARDRAVTAYADRNGQDGLPVGGPADELDARPIVGACQRLARDGDAVNAYIRSDAATHVLRPDVAGDAVDGVGRDLKLLNGPDVVLGLGRNEDHAPVGGVALDGDGRSGLGIDLGLPARKPALERGVFDARQLVRAAAREKQKGGKQ